MSENSIFQKSQVIRNETQQYANTRGRVADVIDDINATKANKTDVDSAIQTVIDEFTTIENAIYSYVDSENDLQDIEINKRLISPDITDTDKYYFIRARANMPADLQLFSLSENTVPIWKGGNFENSKLTQKSGRLGVNNAEPVRDLDVAGDVGAVKYYYTESSTDSTPLKTWTDGVNFYFTDRYGINHTFADAQSNRVVSMGAITATTNTVNVALHSSGANAVVINNQLWEKYTSDTFTFTPPASGETKVLFLYARPNAQILYLTDNIELTEDYLVVAFITVNESGIVIDEPGPQDFLYQSNDSWITQQIVGAESLLVAGNNPGNTFDISVKNGTANPGIAGITAEQKLFWEGRIFWLRNNSPVDIALVDTPVTGELTRFSLVQFEKPAVLKKAGWAAVKIKAGQLVVIETGGGASFPEGGQRGDIIEWDAEGAVWTDRLTNAEAVGQMLTAELAAEIVTRAADDLMEKNARIAADLQEKNERVAADALKQDKSLFSSLTDKFLHFYNATTQKLEPVLKYVAGTGGATNVMEFIGRIKADAFMFTENTTTAIAMRLRSNGNRLLFADKNGVEKPLAYASTDKTGTFNPPTLAQLTALDIGKNDYYVNTATNQRALFDGVQLHDWTVNAATYATLTQEQKNAVRLFNVTDV